MARVVLTPEVSRQFTSGVSELDVPGDSVRGLLRELDKRFPGLGKVLDAGGMAVAIDGDIHQDALLESVGPDSEVVFMPALRGG